MKIIFIITLMISTLSFAAKSIAMDYINPGGERITNLFKCATCRSIKEILRDINFAVIDNQGKMETDYYVTLKQFETKWELVFKDQKGKQIFSSSVAIKDLYILKSSLLSHLKKFDIKSDGLYQYNGELQYLETEEIQRIYNLKTNATVEALEKINLFTYEFWEVRDYLKANGINTLPSGTSSERLAFDSTFLVRLDDRGEINFHFRSDYKNVNSKLYDEVYYNVRYMTDFKDAEPIKEMIINTIARDMKTAKCGADWLAAFKQNMSQKIVY